MNAEEMYQEVVLDHYRHPKNFGKVDNPDVRSRDSNPSCGDIIEITMRLDKEERMKDVKFSGKGCAISQAAASMLTEFLKGKKVREVKDLKKEDILEMLGIPLSGIRLKCALLSLKVVKMGAYQYLGQKGEDDDYA